MIIAKKQIHTAIGIVRRGQHVLTAWRKFSPPIQARWEFPGGKVRMNEDLKTALCRELLEEINIKVSVGLPIIRARHDYGSDQVLLDAHEVQVTAGTIRACEKQFLRWYPIAALKMADFPAANRGLLSALQLPDQYAITADQTGTDSIQGIDRILRAGVQLILLRGSTFSDNYEQLARTVKYIHSQGAQCMLHDCSDWVLPLQAAGVHLSQTAMRTIDRRPVPEFCYFSVSCHSLAEIKAAESLGADFCVLGPVAPTPSHPEAQTLGMKTFMAIVDQAKIPVFALGGMRMNQLENVRRCGGQGIAGIRCFAEEELLKRSGL